MKELCVIAFGMKYAKIGAYAFSPGRGCSCLSQAERRGLFAGGAHTKGCSKSADGAILLAEDTKDGVV